MASIRDLKKEINFITDDFIYDCYITEELFPVSTIVDIEKLVDDILTAREILVAKIHSPEKKHKRNINKDKAALKTRKINYKKEIEKSFHEFINTIEEGYTQLSGLTKEKA